MNLLQSVLQAVLPSAPTAETFQVQTFPNQFATDPKQIHVLHTNPRRLSVPNDRPATRRTTSSSGSPAGPSPTSRKRRNAAAVFLDKHDHMASDPIEVEDSDEDNGQLRQIYVPSKEIVERVQRPKKLRPKKPPFPQKSQHSSKPSEWQRLFGDRAPPDKDGVPIVVPGTVMKSTKPGPLRPVNTLTNNSPFDQSFVRRLSPQSNGQIPNDRGGPYYEKKIAKARRSSHTEERFSKRRRIALPHEDNMTEQEPIMIDDDNEIDQDNRDELAQSSGGYGQRSGPMGKQPFPSSAGAGRKSTIEDVLRVGEYHKIEGMMDSRKRKPLQVIDSQDELASLSDDELFTKEARQQRIRSERRSSLRSTPNRPRPVEVPETMKDKSIEHGALKGNSSTSPSQSDYEDTGSPDILQEPQGTPINGDRFRKTPLHRISSSSLAKVINDGGSQLAHHQKRSPSVETLNGKFPKGSNPKLRVSQPKTTQAKMKAGDTKHEFQLRRLRHATLPDDFKYMVKLDPIEETLELFPQDRPLLDPDALLTMPLSRVQTINQGQNSCTMVMLALTRQEGSTNDIKMFLELESQKDMWDFIRLVVRLAHGDPKIYPKDDSWMENAFRNHDQVQLRQTQKVGASGSQMTSNPRGPPFAESPHPTESSALRPQRSRPRHTDQLQRSEIQAIWKDGSAISKPRLVITGTERDTDRVRGSNAANDESHNDSTNQAPSRLSRTAGMVSKFFLPDRVMRSSPKNKNDAEDDSNTKSHVHKLKFSETGGLGTPWKKPLVYPRTGKKKETVDFQDLCRLDDDEFLNDNLIGFYLRYLEHHLEKNNPTVAKKVHFFNSYFFERLTQAQKGTRGINYAAVQKWTRTVDIFSRDFVIVPVNENLHWYVAIICNLPNLRRKLADDDHAEDDEDTTEEVERVVHSQKSEGFTNGDNPGDFELADEPNAKTASSFAELSLGDEGKAAQRDEDVPIFTSDVVTHPVPQSSSKARKGPGRRKSIRRSLIKIDPERPVVLTLDSLGLSRTATRTALKDYVVEEGKEKRNLELERGALEGVTAKGIPTQKNYSDCGLFVCAYMERFVLDPYQFVRDILQRDMDDSKNWPMYSSDDLRSRLRHLVMELHREQEGEKSEVSIPEVGKILLQKPLPPIPQESEPDLQEIEGESHSDDVASSQVNHALTRAASITAEANSSPDQSQGALRQLAVEAVNWTSPEKASTAARKTPQPPIVIPDDSPASSGPRHLSSTVRSRANFGDDFIDKPEELADKMRRERSPSEPQALVHSGSRHPQFLQGIEDAVNNDEMPEAWEKDEIPETQSQTNASRAIEKPGDLAKDILPGI